MGWAKSAHPPTLILRVRVGRSERGALPGIRRAPGPSRSDRSRWPGLSHRLGMCSEQRYGSWMRVRFVGSRSSGGERHGSGFLTVGAEYVVLSVEVSPREGVRFRIQSDDGLTPALHEAAEFDLVSDAVPSNWRIAVGAGGSTAAFELAPAEWLEPGFWSDFFGDGDVAAIAAHDVFRRECAVIVAES